VTPGPAASQNGLRVNPSFGVAGSLCHCSTIIFYCRGWPAWRMWLLYYPVQSDMRADQRRHVNLALGEWLRLDVADFVPEHDIAR
jgi:hypothetical protein